MTFSGVPGMNNTFLEHLEALRQALLRTVLALAFAIIPCFLGAEWLLPRVLDLLAASAPGVKFHYFSPLEPFLIQLKLSLFLAFTITLPWTLWQWHRFLAPGLYQKEKKALAIGVLSGLLLFTAGTLFAFFLVLPPLLRFSMGFAEQSLQPVIGLDAFVSLASLLMLGFGLIFQLPLIVLTMVKLGLIRVETLRKNRPLAVVVIFILGAVLTPPDVLSQLLMAGPALLLFELSLLIARKLEPPEPDWDTGTLPVESAPDLSPQKTEIPRQAPSPEETEELQYPADALDDYAAYRRKRRGIRGGRPSRRNH